MQMATAQYTPKDVVGDLGGMPVTIPRHMAEFVGLDLEMTFMESYHEVLDVIEEVFLSIFDGLNQRCRAEIEAVRALTPHLAFQTAQKKLFSFSRYPFTTRSRHPPLVSFRLENRSLTRITWIFFELRSVLMQFSTPSIVGYSRAPRTTAAGRLRVCFDCESVVRFTYDATRDAGADRYISRAAGVRV